jgi:hypothetical protein
MNTPPLPTALNTDEDWAKACAWLAHYRLILHVPLRGEVWFERKEPVADVERR